MHPETKARISIKKERYMQIFYDSTMIKGNVVYFDSNYFELRIWDRYPNKIEYLTEPSKHSHYNKNIREGWYFSDSLTKAINYKEPTQELHYFISGKKPTTYLVFYRSTDIEKFYFSEIDSIQCRKTDNNATPGIELVILPLIIVSSPIWNYTDGHYNWGFIGAITGILALEITHLMINDLRNTLRTYDLEIYKVLKIKGNP